MKSKRRRKEKRGEIEIHTMTMYCLSSITRTPIIASLADDHSLPSSSSSHSIPSSSSGNTNTNTSPTNPLPIRQRTKKKQLAQSNQRRRQQPTIIQIERAIGAGSFRDNEPLDFEERKSVFDGVLPNSTRKFETPVERKLRETGEWLVSESEKSSRSSSGKGYLMVVFKWVLPAWVFLLLVFSGVVKLPFSIPSLDDLIM